MNQQTRYTIFIVFSIAVLMLWQTFVIEPRMPKKKPRPDGGTIALVDGGTAAPVAGAGTAGNSTDGTGTDTATVAAANPDGTPALKLETAAPEERTPVETAKWKAEFTSKGAGLTSFVLTGKKQARPESSGKHEQVDLVRASKAQAVPLAVTVTPLGDDGKPSGPALVTPTHGWRRHPEPVTDRITWELVRDGYELHKTIGWKQDDYRLQFDLDLRRPAGAEQRPLQVAITWPAAGVPQTSASMFAPTSTDILRPACHLEGGGRTIETHAFDEDEPERTFETPPTWVAMDERYFLAGLAPRAGWTDPRCVLRHPTKTEFESLLVGTVNPRPGESALVSADLFLGPKSLDVLRDAGHDFDAAVDFGFFSLFAWPLLFLLKLFHGVVANWGLAIVLLTLTVKAITLPLTNKQMHSMEEMRRLGPHIEELKKKYGGDQQKLNVETMKLYKEHNVQPLGGCLPMLVQMPVWFALYTTLQTSFELYNEPFINGWIMDLTSKDPYYVLPILMTATMVVTQLLTPTTGQTEQMKTVMYVMPVVFGFMMLGLPSGLVLYIFTNNLLSIAHSGWFRRTHGANAPPKPA